MALMPIEAVVFDVGETLVDETRIWGEWADAVEVPRLTFFAALGAVVERGGSYDRGLFEMVRPGLTFEAAAARRGGRAGGFDAEDLYPDARPALQALHEAGFQVGLAANQPAAAAIALERCELAYDWLLISDLERVSKPDPAFFALLVRRAGVPPSASPTSGTVSTTTCCPPPSPVCGRSTCAADRGVSSRPGTRR